MTSGHIPVCVSLLKSFNPHKSSRGDFLSPLTPSYMPFGIRRFNITSKHDAHYNSQSLQALPWQIHLWNFHLLLFPLDSVNVYTKIAPKLFLGAISSNCVFCPFRQDQSRIRIHKIQSVTLLRTSAPHWQINELWFLPAQYHLQK